MTVTLKKSDLLLKKAIYPLHEQKSEATGEVRKLDKNSCRICNEKAGFLDPPTMTGIVLKNNLTISNELLSIIPEQNSYIVKKIDGFKLKALKKISDDATKKAKRSMQKAIRAAVDAKLNNDSHAGHAAEFIAEEDFERAVIQRVFYDWYRHCGISLYHHVPFPRTKPLSVRAAREKANLALTRAIKTIANAKNVKNYLYGKYPMKKCNFIVKPGLEINLDIRMALSAEVILKQAKESAINMQLQNARKCKTELHRPPVCTT